MIQAVAKLVAIAFTLLSPQLTRGDSRSEHFGMEWVRSHPFTITAVMQRSEAISGRAYRDAGLNTFLAWKNRPQLFEWAAKQELPWHFHIDRRKTHDQMQSEISHAIARYPGGQGLLIFDEPKRPDLEGIGAIVAWAKQRYPQMLVYTNGYPTPRDNESAAKLYTPKTIHTGIYDEPPVPYSHEEYLSDIATIVKPDVLMLDVYPFYEMPEADPKWIYLNRYFYTLASLRKVALREKLPYWSFVQAWAKSGYTRLPSESDLRMQVYSSLAFGVTGIAYFTYDNAFDTAMLDNDFKPTSIYQNVAKLNREVGYLGRTLRFLTSTDVRYIPGIPLAEQDMGRTRIPRGLGMYHRSSRVATHVTGISMQATSEDQNALVGFFNDDQGNPYVMIVNLTHGEGKSAAETTVPVAITFAASVDSLSCLSRTTGKQERIELGKDRRIDLRLPGGTGELFKIGGGEFPGLRESSQQRNAPPAE